MSVLPIYISLGRAKPDHVLPSFIENGAPPHLLGRGAPAACSAVASLASCIGVCVRPHRWQIRPSPSQGLEGIIIRCVSAALRGDGNPPEVPIYTHCPSCVPHDICKMFSGYASLLEWGLKGRSPSQVVICLANDILAFPVSSKARNGKVLRCSSIRLAKARQLRLGFV